MRYLSVFLAIFLASLVPAFAQKFTRDEAMLAKVLFKYRGLKTLAHSTRGKMNINAEGVAISADFATTVKLAQPDKFCIETTVKFMGQEFQGIAVSDGKIVWDYDPGAKAYVEQPLSALTGKEPNDSDWLFDRAGIDFATMLFFEIASGDTFKVPKGAEAGIQVKNYPTQQVDGRATYVVPVPVPTGPDKTKGSAKLYVDAADFLLRRARLNMKMPAEGGSKQGLNVDIVIFYSDIRPNVDLPEGTFTFVALDDAKKVEKVVPVFERTFGSK